MTWRSAFRLALALLSLVGASPAAAQGTTSYVRGQLLFYNHLGGYCPASRDCTDARYLEAEHDVFLPVRNAKFSLVSDEGIQIGAGVTDSNGNFRAVWVNLYGESSTRARIEWYAEHKDGRFAVRNSTGGRWVLASPYKTLYAGRTASNPQYLGRFSWGTASAPHAIANLYDGAHRVWANTLSTSNLMRTSFNNLQIRAFVTDGCTTSATACAATGENRIKVVSASSAFSTTVLHEMGHIASHKSKPYRYCGDFSFNGSSGVSWTSPEFACVSFEEAIAEFFANRALYGPANPEPHMCRSESACPDGAFDLEENARDDTCGKLNGATEPNEHRAALTALRYLRDVHDTNDDGSAYAETAAVPLHRFFDALAAFGSGTGQRGVNEPWNATLTALDNSDGRSAMDFRLVLESIEDVDTSVAWYESCNPVGD